MKITYRMEIGIMKGSGRITLREKVHVDECIMKDILDVIAVRKPMTITNIIKVLDLAEDSTIESIEIKED